MVALNVPFWLSQIFGSSLATFFLSFFFPCLRCTFSDVEEVKCVLISKKEPLSVDQLRGFFFNYFFIIFVFIVIHMCLHVIF